MRCAACAESFPACDSLALEVTAKFLLSFDCFEERLEVPCTKTLRAFALNYLVKNSRAVFDRLSEDLQQISFIIAVNENSKLLERSNVFVDFSYPRRNAVVIGRRNAKKFYAS